MSWLAKFKKCFALPLCLQSVLLFGSLTSACANTFCGQIFQCALHFISKRDMGTRTRTRVLFKMLGRSERDGAKCLLWVWIFMPCLCIFACQVMPRPFLPIPLPSSCAIRISLLIALIQRLLLLPLRHFARATRRMRNISASAFRFAFQVCLPLHTSWVQKVQKKNRTRGKRCHGCVKNFLFMLTFHLNVSLFVCQFEVLKSRWLKRSKGLTGRGGLWLQFVPSVQKGNDCKGGWASVLSAC